MNKIDFQEYLEDNVSIPTELVDEIISLTSKNKDFEDYFLNPKPSIKVAYSSISFEHWILLHFEENEKAFYNSRELLCHFDRSGYLILPSSKGDVDFKKGWHLYNYLKTGSREQKDIVENFIQKSLFAISNNIALNTKMQSEISKGKEFYEVNPYSDVFKLVYRLLRNGDIVLATIDSESSFRDYTNITVHKEEGHVNISYIYTGKSNVTTKQITSSFSASNADGEIVLESTVIQIESPDGCVIDSPMVCSGNSVDIIIKFKEELSTPCILAYKVKDKKGYSYSIVWFIPFQ